MRCNVVCTGGRLKSGSAVVAGNSCSIRSKFARFTVRMPHTCGGWMWRRKSDRRAVAELPLRHVDGETEVGEEVSAQDGDRSVCDDEPPHGTADIPAKRSVALYVP